MAATEADDRRFMAAALALAQRGLGRVWPNPAVGCVLVENGSQRVVGRGWTQPGGRPHAETEALRRAGGQAEGATVYVSLEPCSHRGKTGPCVDALIAARVGRVVSAVEDPDPRVAGKGHAALRAAGVALVTGIMAAEAAALNAGFFLRVRCRRPLVTLKLATTLDGRIATAAGESRWITGEAARARVHLLRATHDAVLVGSGTARVDDPALTCRLPGMEDRCPVRIIVAGREAVPSELQVLASASETPTWVVVPEDVAVGPAGETYRRAGAEVRAATAGPDGRPDAGALMTMLGDAGFTRVLVEGGGRIAAALLRSNLVDRVVWFRAPMVIGGDGLPAIRSYGPVALADMRRFMRLDAEAVGDDLMETYERRA